MKIATGTCLCGSVTVNFPTEKDHFDACHCGMCRKWSGGPALTIDSEGRPTFQGEEFITRYRSSDWAERGFCKKCGTHLFYYLKGHDFYNFPLGLIDGNEQRKFHLQVFIDHKPGNYAFSDETEQMTEAEVFAKYAPN